MSLVKSIIPFILLTAFLASCGGPEESQNTSVSSEDVSSSEISEETTSLESSSKESKQPHGPEGSVLVNWYILGSGSLWGENGWSTSGGVQLFSNPNTTDLACILEIEFASGDIFKITDNTTWLGYDRVDTYDGEKNMGTRNFSGADDGYNGTNFKCDIAGTYDIYINVNGVVWLQYSE